MPVGNAPHRSPRRPHAIDDSAPRWAVPIGSVAGTSVSLSYTVFFAAAILTAVSLSFAARPGNSDLPRSAMLGAAFWVSGWIMQAVTYGVLTRLNGLSLPRLNLGLIGIEAMPRFSSSLRCVAIAIATVSSLLMLGCFYRLVEGGFQMPTLASPAQGTWTAPSLGFKPSDSIWRSAAWLCWIQAVVQLYPLPATMGRQMVGGFTDICGKQLELPARAIVFRRCLGLIALLTMAAALVLMSTESGQYFLKWPLVMLLGLLLWVSTRSSDVTDILVGFESATSDPDAEVGVTVRREGLISKLRRIRQARRDNQQLLKALRQEREEAVDASRLDEILNRLHSEGIDALSSEDRKILERVSENLRKQRQSENSGADS